MTHATPVSSERRKSERFAIECLEVMVHCDGRWFPATVTDVSPEGAGLWLPETPGFEVSQTVETDHVGNRASAVVRRIEPRGDGTYRVGIEYLP
jgi:hypothetical protein